MSERRENEKVQVCFSISRPQSRLLELTDDYRDGLLTWIATGHSYWFYSSSHFPYSEDPLSANYVDALALLNVGLWESDLSDVENLNTNRQYAPLRACSMYSLAHHAQSLCPVCAQVVLERLQTVAGLVDTSIRGGQTSLDPRRQPGWICSSC